MFFGPSYNLKTRGMARAIFSLLVDHDLNTATHSYKVEQIAVKFAMKLNLAPQIIQDISHAAILHDIGKLQISQEILNKPGSLSPEEFEIVKKHSEYGFYMLSHIDEFKNIRSAILYHHEKFDGSGYPEGRKGQNIPLISRILTIADVFEAVTSDRPYRQAISPIEALKIIEEGKGTHFDPVLSDVFISLMQSLEVMRGECMVN
ncbi:putative cyclic di-GMP phosphodiesterase [Sporomusa carbonis]|uniref:HD-GYP domain-containing protein n=1 Tax=Sporomusa carbonis TaxID=3076075 RepID=UPI003A5ECEFD